jgi:UPF0271 protein
MIDINCDMGEGMSNDALIMPYITSANIACGYHAGDEDTIRRTIALALANHVNIGAHPSFRDRVNFGRKEFHLSFTEIYDLITEQLWVIKKIGEEMGTRLHHIKPHGALYNMSAKDEGIASIIAKAITDFDAGLVVLGLSGSVSIRAAQAAGLRTRSEVFADRTYQDDGSLTSRKEPHSMIETIEDCVAHVRRMVDEGVVETVSGKRLPVLAETICVHSDGTQAVEFVKAIGTRK